MLGFYRTILDCASIQITKQQVPQIRYLPPKTRVYEEKGGCKLDQENVCIRMHVGIPMGVGQQGLCKSNEAGKGYSAFQEKDDLLSI